jgi:hypothetical protein
MGVCTGDVGAMRRYTTMLVEGSPLRMTAKMPWHIAGRKSVAVIVIEDGPGSSIRPYPLRRAVVKPSSRSVLERATLVTLDGIEVGTPLLAAQPYPQHEQTRRLLRREYASKLPLRGGGKCCSSNMRARGEPEIQGKRGVIPDTMLSRVPGLYCRERAGETCPCVG